MIKNIIFDFDGVIVDSEILASRAFSKYFKNIGYTYQEEEFYKFAGMKTVEVIEILSKKFNIKNKSKFSDDIFELISNVYLNDLMLVKGAKEFISKSNKNHYIGSNSIKNRIINGLNIVGLSNFFSSDRIYSFDMVQNPKPHQSVSQWCHLGMQCPIEMPSWAQCQESRFCLLYCHA